MSAIWFRQNVATSYRFSAQLPAIFLLSHAISAIHFFTESSTQPIDAKRLAARQFGAFPPLTQLLHPPRKPKTHRPPMIPYDSRN